MPKCPEPRAVQSARTRMMRASAALRRDPLNPARIAEHTTAAADYATARTLHVVDRTLAANPATDRAVVAALFATA